MSVDKNAETDKSSPTEEEFNMEMMYLLLDTLGFITERLNSIENRLKEVERKMEITDD